MVEARGYLGGKAEISQELGISSLLRSSILESDGSLRIPIAYQGFDVGGVKFSLYDLTIVGLDSFTLFNILNETGSSTFGNSVKLQKMGATVYMGLSVEAETSKEERVLIERGLNANKVENISVSLTLKDVSINALLLMALDQNRMGQLKIGSIMNTKNIFPCLLSTIHLVGLLEFVTYVKLILILMFFVFSCDEPPREHQN